MPLAQPGVEQCILDLGLIHGFQNVLARQRTYFLNQSLIVRRHLLRDATFASSRFQHLDHLSGVQVEQIKLLIYRWPQPQQGSLQYLLSDTGSSVFLSTPGCAGTGSADTFRGSHESPFSQGDVWLGRAGVPSAGVSRSHCRSV